VVARANFAGLTERDGIPFAFLPMNGVATNAFDIVVRSARPFPDLLPDMRRKLREIDPEIPLYSEGTLQRKLDGLLADRTGLTLLLGSFAALALVLAAVGLYGVLAYDVSQRTREIGIRNAIGATQGQIMALILRQGAIRAGIGLAAGLAGALYLTRFLKSQLFDVPAIDPFSYVAVVLVLGIVALLACWIPARRAARVDPLVALRVD
jgi:ABC-type antimicrobial peptide transport system permease subunit